MTQTYSNPKREADPYALPNVEVFFVNRLEAQYNCENADHADEYTVFSSGWYYWFCLPGCLPDSPPVGPFETERDAIEDAQVDSWQEDEEDE